jgi:nucleoid DNA-binding protein
VTETRKKTFFDHQISLEMGMKIKDVRAITAAFVSKITEALVDYDVVVIEGLGRFTTKRCIPCVRTIGTLSARPKKGQKPKHKKGDTYEVDHYTRVYFKKSETLRELLRIKHGPNGRREKK